MKKRGQVTIFIIIGILLLFIFAGVFYLTKKVTKEEIFKEKLPLEKAPEEFVSLKAFTENCLYSLGKKGLKLLGEQGGYIYPELLGEFDPEKPTDSIGLVLGSLKVPYWYYNAIPNKKNKIKLQSAQPSLFDEEDPSFSIEAQLARYVKENIDDCLGNYSAFQKEGFKISSEGGNQVKVFVKKNTVDFQLEKKLEIKKGKIKKEMKDFYVQIPLRLKHYYEIADLITQVEINHSLLEKQALELIQVFSAVDVNKLPPTSAIIFEVFPTVYWTVTEVKKKLKQMLTSNVPLLRFLNSRNFYRYQYPLSDLSGLYQGTYDSMILPLEGGQDLEITFDYFNWPIYLKVNSKGELIEPQGIVVNYWRLNFGTYHYNTFYDLSYPVLVTLRDPSALEGEGYLFTFALEVNIRNNQPVEKEEEIAPVTLDLSRSMVCDDDKRGKGLLKTLVVDSATREPLEAVQISFTIPEQDVCLMGQTDEEGVFESEYPPVYGGVINFIKPGYLTNFYPIDTYEYREKPGIIGYAIAGYPEKIIELHQFKTINVSIKKKNLEKCINNQCYFGGLLTGGKVVHSFKPDLLDAEHKWVLTSGSIPLKETEQVVLTLTRISDLRENIYQEEFTTAVSLTGDQKQSIQLVPGIYQVEATLILNEEVVFPKEKRCTPDQLLGLIEGECFTINETRMDSFISGILNWNTPETYLKITPDKLYGSEEIVFYLLNQNIKNVPPEPQKRVIEDLTLVGKIANFTQKPEIRKILEPTFH